MTAIRMSTDQLRALVRELDVDDLPSGYIVTIAASPLGNVAVLVEDEYAAFHSGTVSDADGMIFSLGQPVLPADPELAADLYEGR